VSPATPDLDALLAHADWLGRLSRQMCRDQHEAEDAAQEVLLASVHAPPRADSNVRGFLAHVLRNVLRWRHRADDRRRRREHDHAPHDFTEAAGLVAARAEFHQLLGRFVLELPEPQRALVLLCYFEGLDVAAIARRARMSRDAVHGHLRRARDTLRAKLSATGEGRGSGRRSTALLPVLLERPTWLVPGVLMALTMKTKCATAGVVVAAGALCWFALSTGPLSLARAEPSAAAPPVSVAAPVGDPAEPASLARVEIPVTTEVATPLALTDKVGSVTGTVVDFTGVPVAGTRIHVLPMRDGTPAAHTMQADTDEHGRFTVVPQVDGDVLVVAVPLQESPSLTADRQQVVRLRHDVAARGERAMIARGRDTAVGELRLPPTCTITGTVRTPGPAPVAGVAVTWAPDYEWDVSLDHYGVNGLPGGGVHIDVPGRASRRRTDASGRFTIPAAAGTIGYVVLLSPTDDVERLVEPRRVTAPTDVLFDLLAPACVRVLTEGTPMANVSIDFDQSLGRYRTNAAGEVRVARERAVPLRARIDRAGRAPLEFDVPPSATPEQPTIVELGREPPMTPVQVAIASERPITKLFGSLVRLDEKNGGIGVRAAAGEVVTTMTAAAPPGRYRLTLSAPYRMPGDDLFVLTHTQELVVGTAPVHVTALVQHGGRLRCVLTDRDGTIVGGNVQLRAADGSDATPEFDCPSQGVGQRGHVWGGEASTSSQALPAGRYELLFDLGTRGTHRRTVDVRIGEIAEVALALP
jgi:RNA polymerase sigma factor (sigma-70 family)